ncbi:MAG: carboxylesterase family protein [Haliea sp.]|nr:carboxylesterase family protein [Haliea sp.]
MPARTLPLLLWALLLAACSNTPVYTDIDQGRLEGYIDEEVEYYLGVPYAQPPLGKLRWRPPVPAKPWNGTLRARKNPTPCTQFSPLGGGLTGSEDCLYLNIWTPTEKPDKPMPVMVWIHGGGFIVGQGSYFEAEGARLAEREKVVVVAPNYRLGIFGFLAHEGLTAENPEHPSSGNYGIMDQTAALRWVRANIGAFGGDPDRVTIFGQSAGGVSICAQLASPPAQGLFHRAAIQSGPCVSPISTLAAVNKLGMEVEAELGCSEAADTLACMRGKDAKTVANTSPPDPTMGFSEGYTFWWPVQDDIVLPRQFMDAFETGNFNQVPIINGATRDEATLLIWLSHNFRFKPLKADQYMDRLTFLTGSEDLAEKVAQKYPLDDYDSPYDAMVEAFSDGFFNCFSRRQSAALSSHVSLWNYQFDYDEAPFYFFWADLRAYHAAEIQYIMGRPWSFFRSDFKAKERPMANSMMRYWAEFARTGNPNGDGGTTWPVYDESDQTLLFNLENTVATGVHREDCEFWNDLPYLRAPYQ